MIAAEKYTPEPACGPSPANLWTPEQVEAYLIEAAYTNEALPEPDRRFLDGPKCSMPEYRSEPSDFTEVTLNRHVPSPAAISRYMAVLDWLSVIPRFRERKLMYHAFAVQWGERQYRIPWARAKHAAGLTWSNEWCRQMYRIWLVTIASRLNTGQIIFP